jgi:hypothetical protein
MNSLGMQVVRISYDIITTKYKNFKIINLIHIISILNSIFYHYVLRDEMNKIRSHLHMF